MVVVILEFLERMQIQKALLRPFNMKSYADTWRWVHMPQRVYVVPAHFGIRVRRDRTTLNRRIEPN